VAEPSNKLDEPNISEPPGSYCPRHPKRRATMQDQEQEAEVHGSSFSMAEARHIVRDLFIPNPRIYWTDFLLTLVAGGVCYGLVRRAPNGSLLQAGLFVASSLLFFRASLFIHEIVHFRTGTFRVFRFVWNMLCGIPFLVPSFLYYTHLDHHRRKHYGTKQDGEYLPLGHQTPWHILFYLSQSLVIPGVVIVRFLLLTPLTWFCPPLRRWVHRRISSMVMDPTYIRPLPARDLMLAWRVQELCCFLFCATVAVLLVRGVQPGADPTGPFPLRRGVLPMGFLAQAYLTGVMIVLLNAIRTLGAHRFLNDGREMTFVEQLVDSVNYPRRPLITNIWAPVGLRFHALHHLFPAMPYHNLAAAHRRLMDELPADSPYRLTVGDSLFASLRQLWRASRQGEAKKVGATAG
jgi:fatty acid desaturase